MVAARMISLPTMERRDPFAEMERMARQMDLLTKTIFGRPEMQFFPSKVFPAINITEDKEKYYVRAELPGIKADELQVEVTGKNLSISGERKIQSEGENAKYHRKEREEGRFSRVISLPGEVDADSVDAKLINGVLTIAIAKSVAARAKQITVK